MNWLAVLRLLPKVSADQRSLLRGVAVVQLSLGVVAVLLAALSAALMRVRFSSLLSQ